MFVRFYQLPVLSPLSLDASTGDRERGLLVYLHVRVVVAMAVVGVIVGK